MLSFKKLNYDLDHKQLLQITANQIQSQYRNLLQIRWDIFLAEQKCVAFAQLA